MHSCANGLLSSPARERAGGRQARSLSSQLCWVCRKPQSSADRAGAECQCRAVLGAGGDRNPCSGEPLLHPALSLHKESPGSAGSLRGAETPLPSPATLDSLPLPGPDFLLVPLLCWATRCLLPPHQPRGPFLFCPGALLRPLPEPLIWGLALATRPALQAPTSLGSAPYFLWPIQNHLQGWANSQVPILLSACPGLMGKASN